MGLVLVIYMLILFVELLVGCSCIIWKCAASRTEIECKLAIGGTIIGIAVWMLVILVCPCYVSQCDICNALDNVIEKCSHVFGKLQTTKHQEVYINNELYNAAAESRLSRRNEEERKDLLDESQIKSTISKHNSIVRTTDI